MRISLLGCGWLGKRLAIDLLENHEIKGSTRRKGQLDGLNLNIFNVDIDQLNDTIYKFLDSEILVVLIPSKNIKGFINLITEIEKSSIEKVIFISSTSVYKNENKEVDEKGKLKDSSLVKIENLFLNNSNFNTIVIRFGGLFGYDRVPGKFFSDTQVISNPEGFINLIHVDDCVQIINGFIESTVNLNQIYNACIDIHPTRRVFYTEQFIKLGRSIPKFDENSISEYKIVNSDKLKIDLSYEFKYSDFKNI